MRFKNYDQAQMGLFQPRARTVRWSDFPMEARRRALTLLARLLRQHAMARSGTGVRDE